MKFPNKLKGKKGFTLVELCVVMAVAAIVGTMITTTVLFLSKQNNDIQKDSAFISEVTDVQQRINDWVKKYDGTGYEITSNTGMTELTAKKGSSESKLTFSESTIKVDGASVSNKYKNVSGISLQVIVDKSASGNVEGEIVQVRVTAKKNKGSETETLLFPIFADKTRERSVTGKNG